MYNKNKKILFLGCLLLSIFAFPMLGHAKTHVNFNFGFGLGLLAGPRYCEPAPVIVQQPIIVQQPYFVPPPRVVVHKVRYTRPCVVRYYQPAYTEVVEYCY